MPWPSIFHVYCYNAQRGVSTRLPRLATRRGHPELSRLPKAPEIRSLRFRNASPGAPMNLVYGNINTYQIDPSHPLVHYSRNEFRKEVPGFAASTFKLSLYPNALLRPWENVQYMTKVRQKGVSNELHQVLISQAGARHGNLASFPLKEEFPGDRRRKLHSLPMSIVIFVPVSLHSSAFIRNKLKSRIREAIRLVVVRGAKVSKEKSDSIDLTAQEGISKDSRESQLILRDWLYVFRPALELFRFPWHDLIREVRTALEGVRQKGVYLTHQWSSATKSSNMSQRTRFVKKSSHAEQRREERIGSSISPNAFSSDNGVKHQHQSSFSGNHSSKFSNEQRSRQSKESSTPHDQLTKTDPKVQRIQSVLQQPTSQSDVPKVASMRRVKYSHTRQSNNVSKKE